MMWMLASHFLLRLRRVCMYMSHRHHHQTFWIIRIAYRTDIWYLTILGFVLYKNVWKNASKCEIFCFQNKENPPKIYFPRFSSNFRSSKWKMNFLILFQKYGKFWGVFSSSTNLEICRYMRGFLESKRWIKEPALLGQIYKK